MNFISIALPVYNGENYLEEALESICNQNYFDYELVVSDNNSSDRTSEILKKFSGINNRIKIYRSEATLSQVDNVNRAFSFCKGEWVQFFCHDDIMLPGCLQYINKVIDLHKNNDDVGLIGHGPSWLFINGIFQNPTFEFDKKNIYPWKEFKKAEIEIPFKIEELREYKKKTCIEGILDGRPIYLPALTTAVVRKERLIQIGYFNKQYMHFDVFAWIYLLLKSDYIHINQALTVTRIHGAQVAVDARKSLRTIDDNKHFWKKFYKENRSTIDFTIKRRFFLFLKPISISASLLSVNLIKGHVKLVLDTISRLPLIWLPIIGAFLLKNYPREKNRTKELSKHVPVEQIYP